MASSKPKDFESTKGDDIESTKGENKGEVCSVPKRAPSMFKSRPYTTVPSRDVVKLLAKLHAGKRRMSHAKCDIQKENKIT